MVYKYVQICYIRNGSVIQSSFQWLNYVLPKKSRKSAYKTMSWTIRQVEGGLLHECCFPYSIYYICYIHYFSIIQNNA